MLENGKVESVVCQAGRSVAIAKINTIYTFFTLLVKLLVRLAAGSGNSPLLGQAASSGHLHLYVSRKEPGPSPLETIYCDSLFLRTGHP